MNISRIVINTRPRTAWQAINLGVVLARTWYLPLWLSWLIPAICVALVTALVCPSLVSWLPITLVWWLKPLFDRGPLLIASRRLFGESTTLLGVLRQLPRLYSRDCLLALTLRRFSLSRSYDLPVTILEGLHGQSRSTRLSVLHRDGGGEAAWTLLVFVHVEIIFVLAAFSLLFMLIPHEYSYQAIDFVRREVSLDLFVYNAFTFVCMSLVAPFYVVCGFSQYINRRISLEGWGIELQFRDMVQRQKSAARASGSGAMLLSALFFAGVFATLAMFQSTSSYAAEIEIPQPAKVVDHGLIKSDVQAILAGDHFHKTERKSGLRFKNSQSMRSDDVPQWFIRMVEFFERHSEGFASIANFSKMLGVFFGSFAKVIAFIIWISVIALALWLAYLYREFFRQFLPRKQPPLHLHEAPPEQLFGLDLRKSSLPNEPLRDVKHLLEIGDYREAIGLLYRTTLIKLIADRNIAFRSNFTEHDCRMAVSSACANATLSTYFTELSYVWELTAYAHRPPEATSVAILLAQWQQVFADEK